jgi:hypothetical protein
MRIAGSSTDSLRKRTFEHVSLPTPKSPLFALQKDIAIGFAMATGFRTGPYRTILPNWRVIRRRIALKKALHKGDGNA